MAAPHLSVTPSAASSTDAALLVLGVVKGEDGPEFAAGAEEFADLASAFGPLGVTGAADEYRRLAPADGRPSIALIGLGSAVTRATLRSAAGAAIRLSTGVESVALALPVADREQALAVLEAAGTAAYSFTAYRSAPASAAKAPVGDIRLHVPTGLPSDGIADEAAAGAAAVHLVRDLVNTPGADLYPETFAQRTHEAADGLPVTVTELDEVQLEEGGYGGIVGVGRGSTRPPRLVVVRYEPADASQHLAIVGKGITYDSGGLSLKPPVSMVGMKYDMSGAATALAAVLAAARLALPVRVTAWLCLAENMPSGSATRPGDVLRMLDGTTVEVTNTDAEGRLVLADGLVAAAAENPDLIVDVATLTGAARIALGERTVGVMGDDEAVALVMEAASASDEQMWAMPLPPELRSVLDSDIADLTNAKPGYTAGGMLVAAHFLRGFAGTPGGEKGARVGWAHLDIAGPASNGGAPFGGVGKGPTGVAVRTLMTLTARLARA